MGSVYLQALNASIRLQGMSTNSEQQNFCVYEGDAVNINVCVIDQNGIAIDLTGYSIVWVLALDVTQPPLFTKTTSGGTITVTTPTSGMFSISLVPKDTTGLTDDAATFYHEAWIIDPSNNPITVMVGQMSLFKSEKTQS